MKVGTYAVVFTLASVLALAPVGAQEVLLSGFEGDLTTTLGSAWGTGLNHAFVAEGATEGSNAVTITHAPTWTQDFTLDDTQLIGLVTSYDLFKLDVTVPASAEWRQLFVVMQGDGLGWTQLGADVPLGTTSTYTVDLNATGIRAAAQAGGGTWWQIFLIFQGGDAGGPTSITTTLDNIRFEYTALQPDPFPITGQAIEGTSHIMTWESFEGEIYDVQFTEDLVGATWAPVGGLTGVVGLAGSTTVTGPVNGAAAAYQVQWVAPLPVFFDDLESGASGWTTGGNAGDDPFTAWELGTPTTGPGVAHSGTNAYATNLDADYTHNVDVWLRTPVIDLTAVSNATLRFTHWHELEVFSDVPYDFGHVNILDDQGAPLVDKWLTYDGTNDVYRAVKEDVPAAALGQPIMIEFQMTSDSDFENGTRAGWYLDDVGVYP